MYPSNQYGVSLALTVISHMFDCNTGPLYMQSLILFVVGVGCALASNTILTFVVVAFSLITDLCDMQYILDPDGSLGIFSTMPSFY